VVPYLQVDTWRGPVARSALAGPLFVISGLFLR
jgi:hypothetical protein